MQIGPEARYLQIRPALRSATSEIRSLTLSSLPACQKTENPLFVQHPLGLCNKPYTLLRAAGDAPARIFQHLCNQTNHLSKLKRGKTNQLPRHQLHNQLTYSKTDSARTAASFPQKLCQPSKCKRSSQQNLIFS